MPKWAIQHVTNIYAKLSETQQNSGKVSKIVNKYAYFVNNHDVKHLYLQGF